MPNKLKYWRLAGLVLAFLLHGHDAAAALVDTIDVIEKSVVRIVTETSQGTGTGSGFVINCSGYIATNYHVIENGLKIVVVPTNSSTSYDAKVVVRDFQRDLAILHVPNINLSPITLSLAPIKKLQKVYSLGYPSVGDIHEKAKDTTARSGDISRDYTAPWGLEGRNQQLRILHHSAQINPGNSGGPLLDDCGRAVGVNTQGIEGEKPGAFYASHIQELVRLLQYHTIPFQSENSPCLSNVGNGDSGRAEEALQEAEEAKRQADEAKQRADEANREMERAQQKADEAKRRADVATEEIEKARQEAEETKRQAEEAIRRADEANQEMEKAQQKADEAIRRAEEASQQTLVWGILLGSLTLAALLLGLRRPRQQLIQVIDQMSRPIRRRERDGAVQQQVEKQQLANQRPTRGLVLAGFDSQGNRVRIALSPEKFEGQRLGLSLGRHPDLVDEVIQDKQVSRRHLRITVRDDQFYIEDLNSSNGTFLNGHRLSPFRPEPLDYGATVALGGLEVMVSKF